jgi:hypothetical protein
LLGEPLSVLKYETSSLEESVPFHYLPDEMRQDEERFVTKKAEEVKVIVNSQIVDYLGIPSSSSLL